ncbi:hypothetical protein LCGC14_0225730 [marine sediment metagenome]|uniref:Carrier domain-containing protein n=1 Tax=marine sediment metagenome TaxID=412755 RepID=A0A0F9UBS5_9ZZZZ|nr:hypothetical protein [Phycisphaerae bacterium]HDZ42974.1 hypothetical protein [Phycisphaerae bacterium]
MTNNEAKKAVITAITDIQTKSGDEAPSLRSSTVVINGVPGFDSLRGLELSVAMGRLFEIGDDVNICISDDGERALTVAEITDKLMTMKLKSQEE